MQFLPEVKRILKEYNLTLMGINQHIGSLFMTGEAYVDSAKTLLEVAKQFDTIEFLDMGGGFGIPYKKQDGEPVITSYSIHYTKLYEKMREETS